MDDEKMSKIDPYDRGWIEGYNDKYPDNPYELGSIEAAEWDEGYKQGSMDC